MESLMRRYSRAHEKLWDIDWNSLFVYDESSPTCLIWKTSHRAGNKGTLTKRNSLIAGGVSSDNKLILVRDKSRFSIPKIIWVMHNGKIAEGKTIWLKDGNALNARLSNLELRDINYKPEKKYDYNIREYIAYDETSPSCLRWIRRTSKSSNIDVGDVAGSLDESDSYWKVHALGHHYKAHRLVWFLHFGDIQKGHHIDHIDRDRQNNKIDNLRSVPPSINGKNRTINKNNKTGENNIVYGEFVNNNGTLIRRYVVTLSWDGKRTSRSFSLAKYGDEGAWNLAVAFKDKIVQELRYKGVGFTDDHGT
jgi:hypothetical protein